MRSKFEQRSHNLHKKLHKLKETITKNQSPGTNTSTKKGSHITTQHKKIQGKYEIPKTMYLHRDTRLSAEGFKSKTKETSTETRHYQHMR